MALSRSTYHRWLEWFKGRVLRKNRWNEQVIFYSYFVDQECFVDYRLSPILVEPLCRRAKEVHISENIILFTP